MAGKTMAVVGLGKIGTQIANAAIHHKMKVIGYDPFPVLNNIHILSPRVELAGLRREVLAVADFVTVHVPLNKKTTDMVSTEFIEAMKAGALLFNYSRGPVVDEDAVLSALSSGKLSGYITDFPSPGLVGHEKVLISPHLGASTVESEDKCATMAVQELKSYLEYGHVSHSVNFPNLENIPAAWVDSRLIVINHDKPGMIGRFTNILGRHNINIISFANESNGTLGYNLIDCECQVSSVVQREIEEIDGVIRTRVICLQ
jgi:D-3-phosphoglycerate dehydrogenase